MAQKNKNRSILVFGDIHTPYNHPDIFKFLLALKKKYKFDRVVCTGDEIDNHKISFHTSDPDLYGSPKDELLLAIKEFSKLYKIFPKMDIVASNHGSLVSRRLFDAGLPSIVMKSWQDVLKAPKGYTWHDELYLKMSNGQTLHIAHGISKNAVSVAQVKGVNHICGHFHSELKINYFNNGIESKFGAIAGCLVNPQSPAFAYGKNSKLKPALGCIVIENGVPQLIPMKLTKSGRWNNEI